MTRYQIDQAGFEFIAGWEGGRSADGLYRAYWDSFGHVWTIGIGETEGVHAGMVWTAAQAKSDLIRRMASEYMPAIDALGVPLNQNQVNALASFVWNLGPGSMTWDVGRLIRARRFQAAADAMLQYDHAGGVVLAGLLRRREAEKALFLKPPPPPPDPHGYHRFDTTVREFHAPGGVVRHIEERTVVEEYDKERAKTANSAWLTRLKQDCHFFADRIKAAGELSKFDRQWRLSQLQARAAGKKVV